MRVLITGGAGFVGSHLAEALLERGDEVFVLDNLSTGSIDNIAHLKAHPRVPLHHRHASTNEPLLAELIDRCDVVVHLAAAVGVKLIVEAPVHTIETNVHGTEVVLKLANKKKKLVLIASTSEVYGKSTDVPFREDADLVLGPDDEAPLGLRLQQDDRRVPGAGLLEGAQAAGHHRPALQYRRAAADRAVRDGDPELRAAGAGRPADHGLRRRHAVAQLHLRRGRRAGYGSLDRRAARRSARSSTSATASEITIGDLAEKVKTTDRQQLRDRARFPTTRPTRPGSRTCRAASRTSRKIRALIGYAPTVELDEILTRVIEHFRQQ